MPQSPRHVGGFPTQRGNVDDDHAATQAQHYVNRASYEMKADEIAAFYLRLKQHRIPPAVRREFTILEFWPADVTAWEDDD